MSTVSEKLTYLNNTKSLLKTVINYADAEIDNNTTFRNYAVKLYDAYVDILKGNYSLLEGMPKGTGTGATISITNAEDLPVYELKMSKESSQHTTTGKNKFNGNAVSTTNTSNWEVSFQNNILTITHKTSYTTGAPKLELGTLPAGTYILSGTLDSNFGLNVNGSYSKSINNGDTFTCDGTQTIDLVISTSGFDSGTSREYKNVQLELGTTATSYEEYTGGLASPNPDYPQEVKTVKGYRNIFNKNAVTIINGYIGTSGSWNGDSGSRSFRVACEPNKTYCISCKNSNETIFRAGYTTSEDVPPPSIQLYDYTRYSNVNNPIIVTTDSSAKYLVIQFGASQINTSIETLQIIEGNEALPYVPYGNNYIAVNVSDGNTTNSYPIPLNNNEIVGIGDYLDELIVDKTGHAYLNKKMGKVVFDGSETFAKNGTQYAYSKSKIENNNLLASTTDYFCNYFKVVSSGTTIGTTRVGAENLMFYYSGDVGFLVWLSTHNTEVYYPLATPELIDLQTTVDIRLFKGANTITNSDGATMKIRYVESIDSLVARVEALEEANS